MAFWRSTMKRHPTIAVVEMLRTFRCQDCRAMAVGRRVFLSFAETPGHNPHAFSPRGTFYALRMDRHSRSRSSRGRRLGLSARRGHIRERNQQDGLDVAG